MFQKKLTSSLNQSQNYNCKDGAIINKKKSYQIFFYFRLSLNEISYFYHNRTILLFKIITNDNYYQMQNLFSKKIDKRLHYLVCKMV